MAGDAAVAAAGRAISSLLIYFCSLNSIFCWMQKKCVRGFGSEGLGGSRRGSCPRAKASLLLHTIAGVLVWWGIKGASWHFFTLGGGDEEPYGFESEIYYLEQ